MLFKESFSYVSDNTNVRWIKIFHLYKGFNRKKTTIGFFTKGSCRVVEPPRIEYKGFKYKFLIKGDITKQLFIRSTRKYFCKTGKTVLLNNNSSICIKKKQEPKSKFLNGPFLRLSKRKKAATLFSKVI